MRQVSVVLANDSFQSFAKPIAGGILPGHKEYYILCLIYLLCPKVLITGTLAPRLGLTIFERTATWVAATFESSALKDNQWKDALIRSGGHEVDCKALIRSA